LYGHRVDAKPAHQQGQPKAKEGLADARARNAGAFGCGLSAQSDSDLLKSRIIDDPKIGHIVRSGAA
jgi:hypothetical protein